MTKSRMLLAISSIVMLVGANPSFAVDTTLTVSGDSVTSDCAAAKSPSTAIELSGSLAGCLAIFAEHFNCRELNGFAFSTELGREEFDGTLDGKPVRFNTTYAFDAIWPSGSCPAPTATAEIAGSCIHYVSGEGITGVIRFYDIIPEIGRGVTNFLYEGVLTVSDDTTAAITPTAPPSYDVALASQQGNLRSQSSSC
jgi:hypothetical protein